MEEERKVPGFKARPLPHTLDEPSMVYPERSEPKAPEELARPFHLRGVERSNTSKESFLAKVEREHETTIQSKGEPSAAHAAVCRAQGRTAGDRAGRHSTTGS